MLWLRGFDVVVDIVGFVVEGLKCCRVGGRGVIMWY